MAASKTERTQTPQRVQGRGTPRNRVSVKPAKRAYTQAPSREGRGDDWPSRKKEECVNRGIGKKKQENLKVTEKKIGQNDT